jgi:hypothetical protein
MKKIACYTVLLIAVVALLSACAANPSGARDSYGRCQANKTNNHKQGRTFIQ